MVWQIQAALLADLKAAFVADLRSNAIPKAVVADSGLASHLIGPSPDRLAEPDGALGPLLEAFVAMELIKHLLWSDEMVEVFHFRTATRLNSTSSSRTQRA